MELSDKIKRIYVYYRPIFLVLPAFIIFLIFFVIPVAGLFILAFDKPVAGVIDIQAQWTIKSFVRIYSRSLYFDAVVTSVSLAAIVSLIALIILCLISKKMPKMTSQIRFARIERFS